MCRLRKWTSYVVVVIIIIIITIIIIFMTIIMIVIIIIIIAIVIKETQISIFFCRSVPTVKVFETRTFTLNI